MFFPQFLEETEAAFLTVDIRPQLTQILVEPLVYRGFQDFIFMPDSESSGADYRSTMLAFNPFSSTITTMISERILRRMQDLPKGFALPKRTYTSFKPTLTRKKGGVCTVCCQQITSGVRVAKLQCKHRYHLQCITKWLNCKNTCPLCRAQVR